MKPEGSAPGDAAVILLGHQPRRARRSASFGVALQLSGHTHGGMVIGLDRLAARANAGYLPAMLRSRFSVRTIIITTPLVDLRFHTTSALILRRCVLFKLLLKINRLLAAAEDASPPALAALFVLRTSRREIEGDTVY
jgi:hypothetical protein